jgi:hypothetical protein
VEQARALGFSDLAIGAGRGAALREQLDTLLAVKSRVDKLANG